MEAAMQATIPYLTIKGAADAVAFYQKAFNATENARMMAQDGKRIMHVDLTIKGGSVYMSDDFAESSSGSLAPSAQRPSSVSVCINASSPADVDSTFKSAIAAGGKADLAPENMPWGARFAMLTDPSGQRWMLTALLA
jgi:PhnB protein